MTETVTIEKQVWESKLHRSMVLQAENERLKHDVGNLGYKIKNQRHEIDNRLKEIEKLKELLKECQGSIATLLAKRITEVNGIKQKELLAKINQVLGEE